MGLHEQRAYMRIWWPDFKTRVQRGTLKAIGNLSPAPLCTTYKIEICLPGGGVPAVKVLDPHLSPRDQADRIPHMYEQERLCLYLPGTGQWTLDKPIAVTIVPWTSLWLYFYEVWRATGNWLGGGIEPEIKPPIRRDRES
jgi:hypothetical protein